ncbi:tripartite motif-containing protein 16-like [Centropristis striata]|uniref:tripartite motif-containing protein 16-like n=1 Tax=Centropristis striata TaxID=184440 RepID=UPI0027DF3ED1|nr:tripartite motif-containing protein 16-like [Centropristis striata]
MAQKVKLDRETFSCSICLDLLKDPVTIPCGHSYCMNCIKSHWDGEDEKEIYSCPQCRKTFTLRPVLVKNTMLADLVEELKKSGLPAAPADHCYAGPDDVACDVCSGRKLKATKSCLICLVSYCDEHLQPHYESSAFEKHQLVEPSKNLQENICSRHDDAMDMLTYSDDDDSELGGTEMYWEIETTRQNIQKMIQVREKDVKLLHQEVEAINRSAKKAVKDNEKTFNELISLMRRRSSELKQQVRSQQETEVRRVKELQEKLQQEITELKRKEAEVHELSQNRQVVMRSYYTLSHLYEYVSSLSSVNIRPLSYFEDVTAAVSEVRDKLQDVLEEKWTDVSLSVTEVEVLLPKPEPETRAGFLKYACELTLDPNSANRPLSLSEGNRKITWDSPDDPKDRPVRLQVLSKESLSGRCYWEVEWKGETVSVAVAYKNSHETKSFNVAFGDNDKSWALDCHARTRFQHHPYYQPISCPKPSRLGMYLDHKAGVLSFYSVSDTMTLLYRALAIFTEPLYAGLSFYCFDPVTVEFCKLK